MVFYEPGKTDHGLPHDPFKACVVPRPVRLPSLARPPGPAHTAHQSLWSQIGWISTLNTDGSANLAP